MKYKKKGMAQRSHQSGQYIQEQHNPYTSQYNISKNSTTHSPVNTTYPRTARPIHHCMQHIDMSNVISSNVTHLYLYSTIANASGTTEFPFLLTYSRIVASLRRDPVRGAPRAITINNDHREIHSFLQCT